MPLDNFEQHLESFVLNTRNAYESARNEINRLNTTKNEYMKICRGFRVFEYALCQKTKTRKRRKSTQSFFQIKKHPVLTLYRYYKTAKNQSVYYLSTMLALRIIKVNLKLQ